MELFAVTLYGLPEASIGSLERILSSAFKGLHARGGSPLRWDIDAAGSRITCVSEGRRAPGAARVTALIAGMAEAGAEFIMRELEPGEVRRMVAREYGAERQEEQDGIISYSLKTLTGATGPEARLSRARRKRRMADELAACLREHPTLSLYGFASFRLGDYRQELREIVEDAAQEYLMDRQYREFISLLRYVVDVRETRIPVIHLIHQGNGLQVRDARFRPVELAVETKLNEPGSGTDAEEMIVSSLISASPKRIVIHSRQPAAPVIRTIEGIFAGRVRICRRCGSCSPYFSISGVPDK